jgi:hypothetical protein
MTYHRRNSPLGDLTDTVQTFIDVSADPYLPEVICRVKQLKSIDRGELVEVCTNTPRGMMGGVGIRTAIPALRAYVYAQRNPWVYAVAALGVLGVPMLLGYHLGKRAK